MNWRMFLTFLSVVLLIMGSVHGYLFQRMVLATALPPPWPLILGGVLILAVVSIPLSFVASRRLPKGQARFLVIPSYVWLGFVFQTFFLVLALDIVRLSARLLLSLAGQAQLLPSGPDAVFLWRATMGTAVAITTLATAFAIWWGLGRLVVRRLEIPLSGLPPSLDGFTILHLSDLHLDLVHGGSWLEKVVDQANAQNPDLVAITGDLAEGTVAQYGRDAEAMGKLEARHGVYFVTGNHEYFHDLEGWLQYLRARGIRVLRNEWTPVGADGACFDLVGIDDHDGGRLAEGHGPDLAGALAGRDSHRPAILLAHQPRIVLDPEANNVDLILSGHTHGGQIWPFSYLVYLQQPYVRGLIHHGETQLYISSGTGFWGPPMRLGTTAEMAVLTLRARE